MRNIIILFMSAAICASSFAQIAVDDDQAVIQVGRDGASVTAHVAIAIEGEGDISPEAIDLIEPYTMFPSAWIRAVTATSRDGYGFSGWRYYDLNTGSNLVLITTNTTLEVLFVDSIYDLADTNAAKIISHNNFGNITATFSPIPESAPKIHMSGFYESLSGETIIIDATPVAGYPTDFTYQWYFGAQPLSGETNSMITFIGSSSYNNTNWSVTVSNSVGSTSVSFIYQVFTDTDGDGLSDGSEIYVHLTNPDYADTDEDGLSDGAEVNAYGTNPLDTDSDGDGLQDEEEINIYGTNALDLDSDDDGLSDGEEVAEHGTDPLHADSDRDGLFDLEELSKIIVWGNRDNGQTSPPSSISSVVDLTAGSQHSLAILLDGSVEGWGDNGFGEIDIPAHATNCVEVEAGYNHSIALREDGSVVAWGQNTEGQANVPSGVTNAVSISANGNHNLALLSDGSVIAWGQNTEGQCNVPEGLTGVTSIAAGSGHSYALLNDGSIVAWGNNDHGQCNVPASVTDAAMVAGGIQYGLALLSDGSVTAWGRNDRGQLNIPSGVSNAVSIDADGYCSLALLEDGSVVAWGDNTAGQATVPLSVSNARSVVRGTWHSLALCMKADPLDDDSDDDGILDGEEVKTYATDPSDFDSDDDGISDAAEIITYGTNPIKSDSDSDGLGDYQELFTYSTDPNNWDMDNDGLSDGQEVLIYNSNPNLADTDADGFNDLFETNTGFDPTSGTSTPDLLATIQTAIEFQFNAANGINYRIEATDSLTNAWDIIETDITGQGYVVKRLYSIEGQPNRFFRAKRN